MIQDCDAVQSIFHINRENVALNQATVLEEAGQPEKALEELAKKEGKIVSQLL